MIKATKKPTCFFVQLKMKKKLNLPDDFSWFRLEIEQNNNCKNAYEIRYMFRNSKNKNIVRTIFFQIKKYKEYSVL